MNRKYALGDIISYKSDDPTRVDIVMIVGYGRDIRNAEDYYDLVVIHTTMYQGNYDTTINAAVAETEYEVVA
jgi:hypothetical protein